MTIKLGIAIMMTIKLGKASWGTIMNREDILERSRKDNSDLDELQQRETVYGFGFGGITVALLCFVFSVIKALQGQRFYEFGAIIFAYSSATAFYSWYKTRKKRFLWSGIVCGVHVVLSFIAYFLLQVDK